TTSMYVPGTLTSPDVRLSMDTGFTTDWNNFVNSSFNSTSFDQIQYKPFVSSGNVSCSSIPFHPGSCLGFTPELNSLNWMGIYNEGVALWNSWADGGDFSNFLYSGLVRLTAPSGKSYRLESTNTDFPISADVNAPSLAYAAVVNHGDVALTVWRQGATLIGRYNQISTGQALGNPFNINSAASTGNYVLKAKNGKAVLVWNSGDNLYVSVRDLTNLSTIVSETFVGSNMASQGFSGFSYTWDVVVGNNRAAIFWTQVSSSFTPDSGCGVFWFCPGTFVFNYQGVARWIRLDNGTFQGGNTNIVNFVYTKYFDMSSMPYYYDIPYLQAAANDNNQVVFGWVLVRQSSEDHTVYGSVYDMTTGTIIGTDKTLLSESTRPVDTLQVAAATGRGMVLWRRNDGMILGRGIDTSNSNLLGNSNVEVESGGVDSLKLNSFGDRGLFTYRKNGKDLFLKVLDLQAGQLLYPNALSLAQANVDSRNFVNSVLAGNKILTTWDQVNGTRRTNWGRVSDISTFTVDGPKEFQISTTNEGVQYTPRAVVNDNGFGLVAWISQDKTQQRIRGAKVDLANPGALKYGLNNFFVSPLIERDYTIRAKIKY
ncbi:LIC12048 family lipoprotein, partial [Leptospira interrogans]|uniref:LIC12048 family lipoprotein n=1 Tax=Leptospira interrogans TaxID=173 RepID=UPI000ABD8954